MSFNKRIAKISAAIGLSWLLLAGVAIAKEKSPQDVDEADQWAREALVRSGYHVNNVDSHYLLYGDKNGNYGIALARVVSTSLEPSGGYTYRVFWQDYAHEQREAIELWPKFAFRFKVALDYLTSNARREATENDAREFAQFQSQAKTWKDAAVKPTMPEAAHEHQVLAEAAYKDKDIDKAISQYLSALCAFPTWPDGQFNLATLAGEQKLYEVAILHMKEYLELTPNSSDAQTAKDNMIIWKDKLQTVLARVETGADQSKRVHKAGFGAR